MEEIRLDVQIRDGLGQRELKDVRKNGFLPAVIYGEDKKPTTVKLDKRGYEKIMRKHKGESVIFHLNVLEGDKKLRDYTVIVKEEQHDPVNNQILHIDFKRISLKEELEVKVALAIKGEPIGVKKDGGVMDQLLWELDVVCLPTNIPQHIDVHVENLVIGQSIHVGDIVLPAGVRTEHDPETVIVAVHAKKEEVISDAGAEGEGLTEPEVIKEKGKAEAEEAQGEKAEEKAPKASEKKEEGK
jgi:large subunit ribosomal protein L25